MKEKNNKEIRQSKVSIFCTHAIEVLWLFLLVALPLFYFRSHQSFNMPKIQLMCITVAFMIALYIIKSIEEKRFDVRASAMLWLMTAYLGIMGLSTIFSYYPASSWWGTYTRFEGMITYVFYFYAFYLIFWHLKKLPQAYRFFMVAALGSLPVSIYGFFQHFGYDFLNFSIDGSGFKEIISTMGNQLYLSDYLIIVLPLVFSLVLISKKWPTRLAWLSLVFIDIYALFLTGRRSGFVALVVIIAFGGFLLLWRWKRSIALGACALAIVALIAISLNFTVITQSDFVQNSTYLRKVSSIFNFEDTTIKERLAVWQITAGFIKERPIIGYGVETFVYVFDAKYPPSFTEMPETIFDHAHNFFLDSAFRVGLVGLAVYLSIFGLALFQNLKIFFKEKKQWYSYLGFGISLALVGFLAHNQFMFENSATRFFIFSLLALSAALPLAVKKAHKEAEVLPEPTKPSANIKFWYAPEYKIFYYAILIAVLAYSIKFHIFPIVGDYNFNTAHNFTSIEHQSAREEKLKKAMYYIPDIRSAVYYQRLATDYFIFGQSVEAKQSDDPTEEDIEGYDQAVAEARDINFQQSIDWYNKGIEKDPRRYQLFQEQAQVYIIWSLFTEDESLAQERLDTGNELFEKTLSISPRQSVYWDWGRVLISIDKNEEALEKYLNAVEMDPEVGRSYFELFKAYRDSEQPELAQEALKKARELGWMRGIEDQPL